MHLRLGLRISLGPHCEKSSLLTPADKQSLGIAEIQGSGDRGPSYLSER